MYMEKEISYLNLFGVEVKMWLFMFSVFVIVFLFITLLVSLWAIFAEDSNYSEKFVFSFIGMISAFALLLAVFFIDYEEELCRPEMYPISGKVLVIDKEKKTDFVGRVKVSLQTEDNCLIEVFLLEDYMNDSNVGLGDWISGETYSENVVLEKKNE